VEQKVQSARDEAVNVPYPSITEVAQEAYDVVWRIMSKGSDKSQFGDWLVKDKPTHDYHISRAIRHLSTAQMQLHKSSPCPDANGENSIDHLERALVRAIFTIIQIKKGIPRL
jgi:hypothetical protein